MKLIMMYYEELLFQKGIKIITEKAIELLYPNYRKSFDDHLFDEVLQDLIIDESDSLMDQLFSSICDESLSD